MGELSFGVVKGFLVDPERFMTLASVTDTCLLTCAGFLLCSRDLGDSGIEPGTQK